MDTKNSRRRSLNKKILIGIGVFIALFIVLGAISSSGQNSDTSENQKENLSEEVDNQLKKSLGVNSYTDSDIPQFVAINGFEDTGNGDVSVSYQLKCTKDEAKFLSRQVLTYVGAGVKGLNSITVICTDGTTDFTSRGEVFND